MDPEENQAPQLDAASSAFDEAIRAGKYDAVEAPPTDEGVAGQPSPLLAALDEVEGKPPAEVAPEMQSVAQENAAPTEAQTEDFKRKYESVAGNNRQLQQMLAQERQQREQHAQALAQLQAQMQEQQDLTNIRASVPAELQEQAVAEYRKQRGLQQTEQGLEQYRGFLQQQQAQMAQAQLGIFRQALPQEMGSFTDFIAERAQAPAEPLREVLQTEAFQGLYPMVESQRDLDLVAQVLLAVGQVEAKKDLGRKAGNAQRAVQEGTHRDVNTAASGASGQDVVTRINQMSDAAFKKYAETVRQRGSMRAS